MPFDGSGAYVALSPPTYPAVAGEVIYAARFNLVMQDVFDALSATLKRNGTASATANFNLNGFKVVGAVAGTVPGNYIEWQQWTDSFVAPVFGTPSSASPAGGDDSTRLATTNWVRTIIAAASAASMPAQAGKAGKVLRTDGTTAAWTDPEGAGTTLTTTPGAALTVRTKYKLDSTAAAFSVQFPAAPTDEDWIDLVDVSGTCATKPVTILRNGKNIMGLAEDHIIDVPYLPLHWVYSSTYGWTAQ